MSRYHTQPQDALTKQAEPQPIELSFLADLYSGFNGTKMTSQQFHKLNDQLQNFPAQSLARKIKNTNLNSLRKTLFEEMMIILRRKYFPPVQDPSSEITVDQHFKDISLQGEMQEMVRSS